MRLLRANAEALVFLLGKRDYVILRAVLSRYPAIPPGHRRLSRELRGEAADDNQRLLDDALAEQRAENRQRLLTFLQEPGRFTQLKQSWRFTLTPADADWLLQVLNDIRVGSWIQLGSPDFEAGEKVDLSEETAPYFWAMEAAGEYEFDLLRALGGA
jgi:hypothetical protein